MLNGFLINSLLAGAAWNLLNIRILKRLAALLCGETRRRNLKLAGLLLAKFSLLYPAGIWLLWSGAVHRLGFAAGFTVVLVATAASLLRQSRPMKVSSHAA